MAFDAHVNFAYATVATAPAPATSGTSLTLSAGGGAGMPTPPFNMTVWPAGAPALKTNAEIVRVTARSTDTLTIIRAQESTTARAIVVGDQVAATITVKTLTDVEGAIGTTAPAAHHASHEPGGTDALVNAAWTNQANVFTQRQDVSAALPTLTLIDTSQPADARRFQFKNANQVLYAQALNDAETVGGGAVYVERLGHLHTTGDLYEQGRLAPLGHWIDVPFSAANFGATGGTWTVSHVPRFSYTLIGHTALIQLWVEDSVVGGAPASLNVVLPFPVLAAQNAPIYYYVPPDFGWGIYIQPTTDQYLRLYRNAFGTPFAAASGAEVRAFIPVQLF